MMALRTSLFLFFFLSSYFFTSSAVLVPSQFSVKHQESVEAALRVAVNQYRASLGLSQLACDPTLQITAQLHAYANVLNPDSVTGDCNLHSWGNVFSGHSYSWRVCCYDGVSVERATCMWEKPQEINPNFPGFGYENAYIGPVADADFILKAWKESSSHNDVITNQNAWATTTWVAFGVGVAESTQTNTGHAVLIFSDAADVTFVATSNGQTFNACEGFDLPTPSPTSTPFFVPSASPSPGSEASATPTPFLLPHVSVAAVPSMVVIPTPSTSPVVSVTQSVGLTPSSIPTFFKFAQCKKACKKRKKDCVNDIPAETDEKDRKALSLRCKSQKKDCVKKICRAIK